MYQWFTYVTENIINVLIPRYQNITDVALSIIHCHLIILKTVFDVKRHYCDTAFAKYCCFFNTSSLVANACRFFARLSEKGGRSDRWGSDPWPEVGDKWGRHHSSSRQKVGAHQFPCGCPTECQMVSAGIGGNQSSFLLHGCLLKPG